MAVALLCGALLAGAFGLVKYMHRLARIGPVGKFERVAHFERLVATEPLASNFKTLAEAYVAVEDYPKASSAYGKAADIYRSKKDLNAAYALDRYSQRYETAAIPYIEKTTDPEDAKRYYTGAKFEPVYGCYTGAFIDHEDSIKGTYKDEYGGWRRDVTAFNHLVGSKQAIFFMYLGYGRDFPAKFVTHMNDNGAAAQIAWEPDDLKKVRDDEYLHNFAKKARESKVPIFIRFASEMNGDWTPYHGDPELYKEKFRLVARVMHKEAPNVAMVWCPFEIPARLIEPYYPGDEAADWVGVNIYSVPFLDNDPNRDGQWRNPADGLRFVYNLYAARKPIMVCEYAASHMSSLDMVPRSDFAAHKLGQFYASLPRLYPRVKAVCWLSMNAVKHAIPGRQKNNYALLDDPLVRKRYEQMLYSPYFLSAVSRAAPAIAREEIVPLGAQVVSGSVRLSAWVKTPEEQPVVIWRVNGAEVQRLTDPGPYQWWLDTRGLPNGANSVELLVQDSAGKEIAREARTIEVRN